MRTFVAGVIVTIAVLLGIALVVAQFGLMPTNADATPPDFEKHIASDALDAAMNRHAPRVNNPYPPTDDNLISGMKIYTMNCAVCHGTMDEKPSLLEHSMYPPPPQLLLDPLDDPEWHIYYAIRTGVRYTGMPAWNKALSDQDMWNVTAFLSRVENLPPAVQTYWKNAYGTAPQSHDGEEHEQHGAHKHKD
jgi:mono/diheme cytochrome c family protein